MLLYVKDGIDYSEITELASEQVDNMYVCITFISDSAIQNNIVIDSLSLCGTTQCFIIHYYHPP